MYKSNDKQNKHDHDNLKKHCSATSNLPQRQLGFIHILEHIENNRNRIRSGLCDHQRQKANGLVLRFTQLIKTHDTMKINRKHVMELASGYYHSGAQAKKPLLFDSWLYTPKAKKEFYAQQKKWWGRCVSRAWFELKNMEGMMAVDMAPVRHTKISQIGLYSFKALALGCGSRTINVPSLERSDVSLTFSNPTDLVDWSRSFIKSFGHDGILTFPENHKGSVIFNHKFEKWQFESSKALERSINRFYSNGIILND